MQRKTGLSDLWNAIHKEEKAMLEHRIRLHTCKTSFLNLSLVTCIFYVLSPCMVYIKLSNFILFSLENDDMESSTHCVKLLLLIFIISSRVKMGTSSDCFNFLPIFGSLRSSKCQRNSSLSVNSQSDQRLEIW